MTGSFLSCIFVPNATNQKALEAGREGWDGSSLLQQQPPQEPLGPPPSPLQYRLLSTVIADQLQAIARAEHKGLGEPCRCSRGRTGTSWII